MYVHMYTCIGICILEELPHCAAKREADTDLRKPVFAKSDSLAHEDLSGTLLRIQWVESLGIPPCGPPYIRYLTVTFFKPCGLVLFPLATPVWTVGAKLPKRVPKCLQSTYLKYLRYLPGTYGDAYTPTP